MNCCQPPFHTPDNKRAPPRAVFKEDNRGVSWEKGGTSQSQGMLWGLGSRHPGGSNLGPARRSVSG